MALRRHDNKKTYVVFKGRVPGFYSSWSECHSQVHGFAGCVFRAYSTREEAESAWMRYWAQLYVGDVPNIVNHDNNVIREANHENEGDMVIPEADYANMNEDPVVPVTATMTTTTANMAPHGFLPSILTFVLVVLGLLTVAMIIMTSILVL
ncbi:Ribosomal protein L9/RNase H1, N-terminal [Sesbania bispinosa]|nr:Ribosomal protein L9/RNase H1, N-terminal [Sesbania bispinosa]